MSVLGGCINYLYWKYLKVLRYVKMSIVKQRKTYTSNSGNKINNLEIIKIASYCLL